jgi:hypothetical protein
MPVEAYMMRHAIEPGGSKVARNPNADMLAAARRTAMINKRAMRRIGNRIDLGRSTTHSNVKWKIRARPLATVRAHDGVEAS